MTVFNQAFQIVDGYGVPQTGVTDMSAMAYIDNIPVLDPITFSENLSGFYTISINITGNYNNRYGFYKILTSNPSNQFVVPEWDYINYNDLSTHNIDDVYSQNVRILASSTTYTNTSQYGTITYNVKDNDYFLDEIIIPSKYLPLDNWTNFTFQVFKSDKSINDGILPLGSGTVTVIDTSAGVLRVETGAISSVLVNISGVNSQICYGDVQGHNSNNKRFTVAELTFNVKRDYNNNQ